MNTLESLVPALELCKKIPDEKFEDSALVWTYSCDKTITDPTVERREDVDFCRRNVVNAPPVYPAPTLAEIMEAIDADGWYCPTCYYQANTWQVDCESDDDVNSNSVPDILDAEDHDNPATAALKLWLRVNQLNRTDKTNKEYER